MRFCNPRRTTRQWVVVATLGVIVTGAVFGPRSAVAQGIQVPGLIVSVPPSQVPSATPPAAPPPGVIVGRPPAAGSAVTSPSQGTNRRPTAAQDATDKPKPKPRPPAAGKPAAGTKSAALATGAIAGGKRDQSIVMLVNDDPITGYEIEQRALLMSTGANVGEQAKAIFQGLVKQPGVNDRLKAILQETIQQNQGKSREQIIAAFEKRKQEFGKSLQLQALNSARVGAVGKMRKKAEEELIEERLKLQAARKINSVASDAQVAGMLKNMAQRNNTTPEAMAANFQRMGVEMDSMRQRFRATLSWHSVVRRKFGSFVNVTQGEIDNYVSKIDADDEVELTLQRILMPLPAKLAQKDMVQRLAGADDLRRRFTNCASMADLAKGEPGVRFENLGKRNAKTLTEPTRSLAIAATDGEMLPPNVAAAGIELMAVCARTVAKATDTKRTQAEAELSQREYDVLARRYLSDLKREAHIERR